MKRNAPWLESEIETAISAYFDLLRDQVDGKPTNKSAIYRKLSAEYPVRSAKAFELKFQNISAVLYDEKLPYADGLRPMANYQSALKSAVIKHLSQIKTSDQSPVDILLGKLRRLRTRNYLPVHGKGSGRYGLSLEHYLSVPQNSSRHPDFMGIELKTKRGNTLQTLFSRAPSRYLACKDKRQLVEKFGYYDNKRSRRALYTSFNNIPDTLGFYLAAKKNRIVINKNKVEILDYDSNLLENAILSKHSETAYITVSVGRLRNGSVGCRFDELLYCKIPSIFRFMRMADNGDVYLDFTLSEKNGCIKDHGFLWRVPQGAISNLYKETHLFDLSVN